MQNNTVESLIAAAVIIIAVAFLSFAYSSTHVGSLGSYEIRVALNSVDGIANGADIRLNGIKIGAVTAIDLDHKTYKPVVHLSLRDGIKIPNDSQIRIASSGINGNPYLAIHPGRSGEMLAAGAAWKPQ